MRLLSRLFPALLILCLLATMLPLSVAADANAIIAVSASSLSIGDTLTATFSFSATTVGAVDASVSYDPTVLEFISGNDAAGAGGTVRLAGYATTEGKSLRFVLTFKALKTGSSTLRIESSTVYGWDESLMGNPTAGTTVTVKDASLSQNANLKALTLSAGTLYPAFSANTTVYTVSVNNYITSVNITAAAADSGAKVSISGDSALAVGANKRTITVTAPGGAVKVYTVTITRRTATSATPSTTTTTAPPADPIYVTWHDTQYQVTSPDGQSLPAGFAVGETTVDGKTTPAARSENGKLCLLWLTAESEEGFFVLYDDETGTLSAYSPITVGGETLLMITPENAPDGLVAATREVGGSTADVWVFPEESRADFFVVRCLNAAGEADWYCVDSAQDTVQRYVPVATTTLPAAVTTATPTTTRPSLLVSATTTYLPWIVAGGLALVCIALVVLLVLNRREPRDKNTPAPKH